MTKKTHSGSKEGWPSYAVMWALYRSPPPFKICDPEPVYSMRYNGTEVLGVGTRVRAMGHLFANLNITTTIILFSLAYQDF